jgi:hypothetical protein
MAIKNPRKYSKKKKPRGQRTYSPVAHGVFTGRVDTGSDGGADAVSAYGTEAVRGGGANEGRDWAINVYKKKNIYIYIYIYIYI